MNVNFIRANPPLYCDMGPFEGHMRVELDIMLYLTPEEYTKYESSGVRIVLAGNEVSEEKIA